MTLVASRTIASTLQSKLAGTALWMSRDVARPCDRRKFTTGRSGGWPIRPNRGQLMVHLSGVPSNCGET
jgi:hypothetical protein